MNFKAGLFSVLVATTVFSGCASKNIAQNPLEPSADKSSENLKFSYSSNAVVSLGIDNVYKVTLYSNEYPLPLNKIHSWTAHVETVDGEIVENAKIRVHGGMPAHQHDFPTTPRVKQYLGNGNYLVEGVKFSMPGEWELRLNIKEEKKLKRDSVVFTINL